jgi:hypothetical protein
MFAGALGSVLFALGETFAMVALGRALIGAGMDGILMGALRAFGDGGRRLGGIGGRRPGGPSVRGGIGGRRDRGQTARRAVCTWRDRNTPPGVSWRSSAAGSGGLGQIFRDGRSWRLAPLNAARNGTLLALQGL